MSIQCPTCENELVDIHDTTYSNISTSRCNAGDHTGDIYVCEECDERWLDNFLTGGIEEWRG